MTKYEYMMNAYQILLDNLNESKKAYIESKLGLKGQIFSSFISFVNNYLNRYKYFNSWIDEIDGECVYNEQLTYETALYTIMKNETGLTISKDLCNKIIQYLRENKKEIKLNMEEF